MRIALVAVAVVLLAGSLLAGPITYVAQLSGANESPANNSPGTGSATVIIDSVAHTLEVWVTFSGLIGTTTASHIHCCTAAPFTGTVGVATVLPTFTGFPLGVQSGSYHFLYDTSSTSAFSASFVTAHGGTAAGAEAFLANGMSLNESYLNIHTSNFAGGEIRGFLTQVPEPGTFLLAGIALAGVVFLKRR